MTKYFSPSKLGFFDDSLKKSYDVAGSWPDDAVEITDVAWQTFLDTPTEGKQLGADSSGGPAWVDIPAPTTDELITEAKENQANLITSAKSEISIWQSELLLGTISDSDKILLTNWIAYIKELQAIDMTSLPVTWPAIPATS